MAEWSYLTIKDAFVMALEYDSSASCLPLFDIALEKMESVEIRKNIRLDMTNVMTSYFVEQNGFITKYHFPIFDLKLEAIYKDHYHHPDINNMTNDVVFTFNSKKMILSYYYDVDCLYVCLEEWIREPKDIELCKLQLAIGICIFKKYGNNCSGETKIANLKEPCNNTQEQTICVKDLIRGSYGNWKKVYYNTENLRKNYSCSIS